MRAIGLRCEHREDIPCVDHPQPRLSWRLEDGVRQTAYRVRVGGVGDSGRTEAAETIDVPYGGPALPPASEFTWTVEVWEGDTSSVSEPARFRTGLSHWTARWIRRDRLYDPAVPVPGTDDELDETDMMMRRLRPSPHLRRAFEASAPVRRATLYATARGVLELALN